MPSMSDVLSLYAGASHADLWQLRIRNRLCPFEAIAEYIPTAGLVADLGCGHGLFATLLALGSADRQVLGIEPALHKLRVGCQATSGLPNLQLSQGNALSIPAPRCSAVSLIDVVYLMPPPVQQALLVHCHEHLLPGGVLVLKDVDTRPRWKFTLCCAEERLVGQFVARFSGERFHVQPVKSFYFHSSAEWDAMLHRAGFGEVRAVRMDQGYYLPHLLIHAHRELA